MRNAKVVAVVRSMVLLWLLPLLMMMVRHW